MGEQTQASEELVIELRDALSHLYDRAYLLRHPLARYVRHRDEGDALSLADELKQLLADAVEKLRPDPRTPESDPAWRPYDVLHSRYILGRSAADIEEELLLGTRQVQREQRRGLEMMALALAARPAPPLSAASGPSDALGHELARIADDRRVLDVRAELARSLEVARPLVESHEIRIAEPQVAGSLQLLGNEGIIRQLLVAAISLMVRFAPAGRLTVRAQRQGDRVRMEFVADAPGPRTAPIPEMEIPSRLMALTEALESEAELCRHGGTVTLSLSLAAPPRERLVALVEDNEAVMALFSRYLSGQGYRLVGIGDSANALDALRQLAPDAVILDLMMRGVDGWEVLRALKGDESLQGIPVVVCSVLAEQELARLLGADAYLVKPVRPGQLRQCLDRLLSPDHSRGESPG